MGLPVNSDSAPEGHGGRNRPRGCCAGSWNNNNRDNMLSSNRNNNDPDNRNENIGFRAVVEDAAATRRHHLHVDNAGTLQDRMRQQEVGCLSDFIQGEDCDHRLARATRLQSLYEGLRLAFGHRCIDRRRRHRHTGSAV